MKHESVRSEKKPVACIRCNKPMPAEPWFITNVCRDCYRNSLAVAMVNHDLKREDLASFEKELLKDFNPTEKLLETVTPSSYVRKSLQKKRNNRAKSGLNPESLSDKWIKRVCSFTACSKDFFTKKPKQKYCSKSCGSGYRMEKSRQPMLEVHETK